MLFQRSVLFAQQFVDMFHSLNGFIGKESQFGNDSELVSLQRAELSADSSGIIGNLVHQFLLAIVGEDAQVDIGDTRTSLTEMSTPPICLAYLRKMSLRSFCISRAILC